MDILSRLPAKNTNSKLNILTHLNTHTHTHTLCTEDCHKQDNPMTILSRKMKIVHIVARTTEGPLRT